MPTQQLKITSLETRTANTQYGQKEQWIVNGKWSAFKGEWNKDWAIGGYAKGVFATKESNGKTYHNISCPPELKKTDSLGNTMELREMLAGISKQISQLRDDLLKDKLSNKPGDTDTPATVEETPQEQQLESDIDVENIPF